MFYSKKFRRFCMRVRRYWYGVKEKARERLSDEVIQPVPVAPAEIVTPDDPLFDILLYAQGVVDLEKIHVPSLAVRTLQAARVRLIIPLVNRGELIGMINVGARRSAKDYSSEDRRLLSVLASQVAPIIHYAQLMKEQQEIALEHQRVEQELRVANLIQQTLLPRQLPGPEGWQLASYYAPARFVGGDFYDFLQFEDGQIGMFIGDVTDKGVPAALVMATTRSILRSVAMAERAPHKVLERTNNLLCLDIPPRMFVTCLYAVFNPVSGHLRFANAGHDLPYRWSSARVEKLLAVGVPLGLMPGITYEEHETGIAPGETVLFYSDGLVEAHNQQQEMFGFPRLSGLLEQYRGQRDLIAFVLTHLQGFTGREWEQEDDITIVTLRRNTMCESESDGIDKPTILNSDGWQMLAELELPSEVGNEVAAMEQVAHAILSLQLSPQRIEKIKTAISEATMNAMEHGNHYQKDKPVRIEVTHSTKSLVVRIKDGGEGHPHDEIEIPDITAKLVGSQTPRGWGLFLIKNLVDGLKMEHDGVSCICELTFALGEGANDNA